MYMVKYTYVHCTWFTSKLYKTESCYVYAVSGYVCIYQ